MWYSDKSSSVDFKTIKPRVLLLHGCEWLPSSRVALLCIFSYSQGRGRQMAFPLPRSCTWSWGWTRSWWRFLWSTTHRCPTPRSLPPPHHTRCLGAQRTHRTKTILVIPDEMWVASKWTSCLGNLPNQKKWYTVWLFINAFLCIQWCISSPHITESGVQSKHQWRACVDVFLCSPVSQNAGIGTEKEIIKWE